ncbi:MAG: aldo/keto reductase [Spirochaetes bacterium]|nr:MAG: aldo/keto reductase [Spirochaetota bacterium]
MKYRELGKTGLKVSVVGLGTYQFGGRWAKDYSQKEVNDIFNAARETGINFIDTAECYGANHLSEHLIGNAIANERDKWIVATKFGHKRISFSVQEHHWSAPEVKEQLEESLKSLKTDHIDLYQFHSGSNDAFNNDKLWTMLDKQIKAGKILHLGISLSSRNKDWRIYQAENAAKVGVEVIQVLYNRLNRSAESEIFPVCKKNNLGVIVRVPMASGLLSGKYSTGLRFPENDIRKRDYDGELLDNLLAKVETIKKDEVPEGMPMPVWALTWVLKNPSVTCVIPGAKKPEYVRQNASAADFV